jgi:hypothetical protein
MLQVFLMNLKIFIELFFYHFLSKYLQKQTNFSMEVDCYLLNNLIFVTIFSHKIHLIYLSKNQDFLENLTFIYSMLNLI